ncbi:N-acetyltransferase [Kyrpidia tusciae]|uniref:GCN5-related N-acetyltransferase n=1 Tax=Kyrpidia tusciae (strain DSM 2912 / NBRC 15312 / T2) TaxID=562970 RepID=D5WWV8_KYRT2|nr:N-acetyltransferase [Kyrpidia tusciae]ADG05809.1 GCN5-related N-acetyltransferase [Kyrpidia tusciae DSM 2912]MBE3552013.1 N-acetyltransferase [Kyrpidia tusciae]
MELRKAVVEDVDAMYALIDYYAQQGLLLPRSRLSLYESLQCFSVAVEGERLLGVAGLHILWADLAEIRSLAVAPDARGQGIGGLLVDRLSEEARHLGIPQVLALTYQRRFFEKCGFYPVEKQTLPHKVWKDCVSCSKFATCDEAAYLRVVTPNVSPRLRVSPVIQVTQP